ncbi:putative glycosidase [Helianthus debilis subsp. tardiflorus]
MNKLVFSFLAVCFVVFVHDTIAGEVNGWNLKDVISRVSIPAHKYEQPYRTGYHFQPPSNWMNGTWFFFFFLGGEGVGGGGGGFAFLSIYLP